MTKHYIKTPLKDEDILKLKVRDKVYLSGIIVTARDKAHKYMLKEKIGVDLNGGVLYHCGPIVGKEGGKYEIISAGPTTSERMNLYEAEIIKRYGIKVVIGKGGMSKKTGDALRKYKAVYLSALGGVGVIAAKSIIKVKDVLKLEEFGVPEAIWVLEVKDFPAVVTMDAYGNSLHEIVLRNSKEKLKKIF